MSKIREPRSATCLWIEAEPGANANGNGSHDAAIRDAIYAVLNKADIHFAEAKKLRTPAKISSTLREEVLGATFLMADVSREDPAVHVYLGMAEALDKPFITLRRYRPGKKSCLDRLSGGCHIEYEPTPDGLTEFNRSLRIAVDSILQNETVSDRLFGESAFEIGDAEWKALNLQERENLCFEILLREGFRDLSWVEGTSEIDILAHRSHPEYPEKNLHLVSVDSDPSSPLIQKIWLRDLKIAAGKIAACAQHEEIRKKDGVPVLTVLFVNFPGGSMDIREASPVELTEFARRAAPAVRGKFHLEPAAWGPKHTRRIVLGSPFLAEKYFSGERRMKTNARASLEDLYRGAMSLGQAAVVSARDLAYQYGEEPADKWRQRAYTVTHSIGNAIFPVEIHLVRMKEIFATITGEQESREPVDFFRMAGEGNDKASASLQTLESAKCHIRRFKKFAAIKKSNPGPMSLVPPLERSLSAAESAGIRVSLYVPDDLPEIWGEPDGIDELLDEMVANAITWLREVAEPKITVTVQCVSELDSLTLLLRTRRRDQDPPHILLRFQDNGPGVPKNSKREIFELGLSTNPQGMGYGLPMVQKNLREFGGDIIETGMPGKGAQFDLFFKNAERGSPPGSHSKEV